MLILFLTEKKEWIPIYATHAEKYVKIDLHVYTTSLRQISLLKSVFCIILSIQYRRVAKLAWTMNGPGRWPYIALGRSHGLRYRGSSKLVLSVYVILYFDWIKFL